jgi:hypothetical protein
LCKATRSAFAGGASLGIRLGAAGDAACARFGGWLLAEFPARTPPAAPRATARAAVTEKTYLFKITFLQISRAKDAPE